MLVRKRNAEDIRSCRLPKSEMSEQGGCQCKIDGVTLTKILTGAKEMVFGLSQSQDGEPMLHPEDCGFYDLSSGTHLFTVDLNPVIGIDMFAAGQIGALHAISDIYACGGVPEVAMVTLVLRKEHGSKVAEALEAGALMACASEGIEVVNGQTLYSTETMIGLSVVGRPLAPQPLLKVGARVDDQLFLSKPLGSGMMTRAFTLDVISEDEFGAALRVMLVSNREAMFAALRAEATAGTDVTGFGILGHLSEMLTGSLGAEIYTEDIPVIEGASELPRAIGQTQWISNNLEYATNGINVEIESEINLNILLDPQTNGPLLVAAPPEKADSLIEAGYTLVGRITDGGEIIIK